MKKNTISGILLLILLLVTAGILLRTKDDQKAQGISMPDREFAYSKMDEIEKIVLKRKDYPLQVFTRSNDGWLLNEKDEVNPAVFNNFLAVLKNVDILYIPTKAATQVIYKDLEKNGIQIQLYTKDAKKVRSYTVGTETADGLGTPYMKDGANQPYIMYLPGLEGSVRRRMIYAANEWKNKDIFAENPDMITSLEIRYPRDLSSSFRIDKKGNQYMVTNPDQTDKAAQRPTNQKTAVAYLNMLKSIEAEYNDENNPEKERIMKTPPFCFITIRYEDKTEKKMTFYSYIDISRGIETTSPNQVEEDNKFFISTSEGKFLLGQYRVLKKIIKSNFYFY